MQTIINKAKQIKLLVLDVDGVLTNGLIFYSADGAEMKGFHIHDGLGIKLLKKAGIQVAIISGKKSAAVEKRMQDLRIDHVYLGHENKLPAYEDLINRVQLDDHEIAYMGDDLPDLPLLQRAGLAITVPQAPDIIKQYTDIITTKKGGKGAVREVCELILTAQGRYQAIIQSYLTQPSHID